MPRALTRAAVCVLVITGLTACGGERGAQSATAAADSIPVLTEAWVSAIDTLDNVDSPAVWFSDSGPRVIATAKATDALIVYDAITGAILRRVGGSGAGLGELERPNGVLVLGDSLLLVVERDNRRVQAFRLPSFQSAGAFGASELILPYGLAAYAPRPDAYRVYVTDAYEEPEDSVPANARLNRRVRVYDVAIKSGRLTSQLVNTFGDTTTAGAIRIPESIHLDPVNNRVMIAEEDETDTQIKEYTLEGQFTGRTFGRGVFTQQAEGIALWTCGDSAGYWVTTDQGPVDNFFHLFDRQSLAHIGSFRGKMTNTTDGVALTQRAVGAFTEGMLFTAHFDAAVSSFDWREIARATGATESCAAR